MSAYPDLPIMEMTVERISGPQTRVTRSGRVRSVRVPSVHSIRFTLVHELLTLAEAQQIETLYNDNDTFTFTDLASVTYDCQWSESGAVKTPTGAGYYRVDSEFLATPQ